MILVVVVVWIRIAKASTIFAQGIRVAVGQDIFPVPAGRTVAATVIAAMGRPA